MDAWKLDANKVNERVISGRDALVSVERLDFCIMGIERSYRNNRHQSRNVKWIISTRLIRSVQNIIRRDLPAALCVQGISNRCAFIKCATWRRRVMRRIHQYITRDVKLDDGNDDGDDEEDENEDEGGGDDKNDYDDG